MFNSFLWGVKFGSNKNLKYLYWSFSSVIRKTYQKNVLLPALLFV